MWRGTERSCVSALFCSQIRCVCAFLHWTNSVTCVSVCEQVSLLRCVYGQPPRCVSVCLLLLLLALVRPSISVGVGSMASYRHCPPLLNVSACSLSLWSICCCALPFLPCWISFEASPLLLLLALHLIIFLCITVFLLGSDNGLIVGV